MNFSWLCLRAPNRPFSSKFRKPARIFSMKRKIERLESRVMLSVNADFNGDGYDDLAVGTYAEDIGAIEDAGAVSIIYGGRRGLSARNNQFWHQDVAGIRGVAATNDWFGLGLAAGDFNGDGFSDLAIGVPRDTVNGLVDAGSVNVLYGSKNGLRASGNQLWTQDSPGINGAAGAGDNFGYDLVAGDFNNDGRDDLAISVWQEDESNGQTVVDAGAVNVIYGSASGLTSAGDQFWSQDTSGINDVSEVDDRFGFSVAAGDFNGDGRDDLVVGVALEDVGSVVDAGAVNIIYGSKTGLAAAGDQFWTQNSANIEEIAETNDQFGWDAAAGDFNGDGRDDLVISAIYESVGTTESAGGVNVLYGSSAGIASANDQWWSQDSTGIEDVAEGGDQFGISVAVGDFDHDGFKDLAIGVSGESTEVLAYIHAPNDPDDYIEFRGAAHVIYGSATRLVSTGSQFWHAGKLRMSTDGEQSLGNALTVGDYNGDGFSDLAIGALTDNYEGIERVGSVYVLYDAQFLDTTVPRWHQGLLSSTDGNEEEDFFGFSLA